MLIFPGSPALSSSSKIKLHKKILGISIHNRQISAKYFHFIETKKDLDAQQNATLNKLLTYGLSGDESTDDFSSSDALKEFEQTLSFLVIPRIGTISPWSSKATDIAINCGLGEVVKRVERGILYQLTIATDDMHRVADIHQLLHDKMTESVIEHVDEARQLFSTGTPKPFNVIEISTKGRDALVQSNIELGLALSDAEIDYLYESFTALNRDPSDVELMMFAQANSEHCRHKIFNAKWSIDGEEQDKSLFGMIRNTYQQNQQGILSAYSDNCAVMEGFNSPRFYPLSDSKEYQYHPQDTHILMKVETHNHPTAISPFSGAATGSGGEIRDEGATGRGSKPKAGITGFSVSNLHLPELAQSWEYQYGKPSRIVSALDIMLEAPIGAAAFNNEFGRPGIGGYFRTFEVKYQLDKQNYEMRGYHKPIMLAGGIGNISAEHVHKNSIPAGSDIVVLGGPAMLIGLGGGAASSMNSGSSCEHLDFSSVQRGNPEMERRCQEVIDRCWQMQENNPILSIHDVGAGGISNALPELVNDASMGASFELRLVPNDELQMSPMEIWSNEAQERYVLAIAKDKAELFRQICERERAPFAFIGEATAEQSLKLTDSYFNSTPIDMPMKVLLGNPPAMYREVEHCHYQQEDFTGIEIDFDEALDKVLHLPAVADKKFLITIADRSITGMVIQEQMVGPWQVPVADVAVTSTNLSSITGEAMAIGEKAPIALINHAASARMAVAEAITNIAAAKITDLSDMVLSANWMSPAGHQGEDAGLYDAVKAIGMELCPELGITIPVGKDSMSMKTVWEDQGENKSVTAPMSVVISAFARVTDVRKTLTPQIQTDDIEKTNLLWIDLGAGKSRLAGSALAQVYQKIGQQAPDVDSVERLKNFFYFIQQLNEENKLLAYHDISDGGLMTTLLEMSFAGHCGLDIHLDDICENKSQINAKLFSEELGCVIQVNQRDKEYISSKLSEYNLTDICFNIAQPVREHYIKINYQDEIFFQQKRSVLHKKWSETSYLLQKMRDNPICAQQEYETIDDDFDPGLINQLSFNPAESKLTIFNINKNIRPKMAVLREQGVNGQIEMAAAFDRADFACVDVHMSDILSGAVKLDQFKGLVACGGFSYGDVLGAGEGWAKSILFNHRARDEFEQFFKRSDSFALGVCNGCQMMSNLHELIDGTELWPHFERNLSEQFEARTVAVEILESPSILFTDMVGSKLPIVVAHGEGRANFLSGQKKTAALNEKIVSMQYVDNYGNKTMSYPANPNGSPEGITALTNKDGRFTIMMPHPERVFRDVQNSWKSNKKDQDGAWMKMFYNARKWLN